MLLALAALVWWYMLAGTSQRGGDPGGGAGGGAYGGGAYGAGSRGQGGARRHEQARGYDAAHSVDSRGEARNILRAGLVLMVISCVACAGQFLVLMVMFVWSLTEAAKKEQVEIVRKQRAREIALARLRDLRRKLQRVSQQECPTNELEDSRFMETFTLNFSKY